MDVKVTVWVDNRGLDGFECEHGLALLIETGNRTLDFDTGAGKALLPNMQRLKIDPDQIDGVIFSHGHSDHTGGLSGLMAGRKNCMIPVFMTPGMENPCYSHHSDGAVHDISMPESTRDVLKKMEIRRSGTFSEIMPGIYLTGAIPRVSGEGTGGNFYSDPACTIPHQIGEEQALLFKNGLLISG